MEFIFPKHTFLLLSSFPRAPHTVELPISYRGKHSINTWNTSYFFLNYRHYYNLSSVHNIYETGLGRILLLLKLVLKSQQKTGRRNGWKTEGKAAAVALITEA